MCSDVAISVKNLTKTYRIFGHPGDRIKQAFTLGRVKFHREFTALKDVSFEIKKGETVGIIGRNGSGKSTLLQLICGILKPTSGSVQVNGRVLALLELGAGFNPEFTGRENVYFQGALVGFTEAEMNARFDDIAAFADIGEFIDQPVRTYSSGMFVRLAFAVAAHMDGDVLIIDEALSVGDVFFTQKCMRFLTEFQQTGTVLFVSHDQRAVLSFCKKVIWLADGLCCKYDAAKVVCEAYLADNRAAEASSLPVGVYPKITSEGQEDSDGYRVAGSFQSSVEMRSRIENVPKVGSGRAKITNVLLLDSVGRQLTWTEGGERVLIVIEAAACAPIESAILGFLFKDNRGQVVFGGNAYSNERGGCVSALSGETVRAMFEFIMPILARGEYTIDVAIADGTAVGSTQLEWIYDVVALECRPRQPLAGMLGVSFTKIELHKNGVRDNA